MPKINLKVKFMEPIFVLVQYISKIILKLHKGSLQPWNGMGSHKFAAILYEKKKYELISFRKR